MTTRRDEARLLCAALEKMKGLGGREEGARAALATEQHARRETQQTLTAALVRDWEDREGSGRFPS